MYVNKILMNYIPYCRFNTDDVAATCSKNASVAAKEGLKDLVQVLCYLFCYHCHLYLVYYYFKLKIYNSFICNLNETNSVCVILLFSCVNCRKNIYVCIHYVFIIY